MRVNSKLNQRGSILINVLIVSMLIAVAITSFTASLREMANKTETAKEKQSFISFISSLRRDLEDPHHCYQMLGAQKINPSINGSASSDFKITMYQGKAYSTSIVGVGFKGPQNEFEIGKLEVLTLRRSVFASINGNTLRKVDRQITFDRPLGDDNPLNSYEIQLRFTPRSAIEGKAQLLFTRFLTATPDPNYVINLIVGVNPTTNIIYSCHGKSSIAETCEEAGGAYDATLYTVLHADDPKYRCQPNYRCWVEPEWQNNPPANPNGLRKTAAQPIDTPPLEPNCTIPDPNSPYLQKMWIGRLNNQDLWSCQWCNQNKNSIIPPK